LPFLHTRRVAFSETDALGSAHFTAFYRYMEEAEHALFRSLALPILWQREDGGYYGWPRVSASCEFELPAFAGEVLEIHVRIGRLGASSATLHFDFFRGEESYRRGELVARGSLKICCVLTPLGQAMRAVEMPAEHAARFGELRM